MGTFILFCFIAKTELLVNCGNNKSSHDNHFGYDDVRVVPPPGPPPRHLDHLVRYSAIDAHFEMIIRRPFVSTKRRIDFTESLQVC